MQCIYKIGTQRSGPCREVLPSLFCVSQVVLKMHESFGSLKVERFLQLYKAFLIWPNWVSPTHSRDHAPPPTHTGSVPLPPPSQVVQKYLSQYKIPKDVKICSSTWNEFFSEFVER